jgi:hypothetical protein
LQLTKVILESEFDLAADPQLFKACKDVIPKHCANAVIPKEGQFESVLECLKADFHTGVITDAQCAKQVALGGCPRGNVGVVGETDARGNGRHPSRPRVA